MILLDPGVLVLLKMERLGLCWHCEVRSWRLHMNEDNGNPRLKTLLHPLIAIRIALWRIWVLKRFETGRTWRRDLYLNIGQAHQYARVLRSNALAAGRTA